MTDDQKDFNFKSLLDEQYQFPCCYTFKFVVAANKKTDVMGLLGEGVMIEERSSKMGKYIGLTFSQIVQSSEEVIATYRRISSIEGVISL